MEGNKIYAYLQKSINKLHIFKIIIVDS